MIDDQAYILNQILTLIDESGAGAVLISGDVYDKSVPPAEAVTLFDDFLCRLAQRKLYVFIIAGNHDSAERLAFGGRLMRENRIFLSPLYQGIIHPVELQDDHGSIDFWLLPFLKPIQVRHFYPEEKIESYTDACRTAISHMAVKKDRRNILLAHQFVTGGEVCESEEISVGGTDQVDAACFDVFDYVALGHLHNPQNIGSNRIRYCGTPLKYSFSESRHHKSLSLVNIGEKGSLNLELLPLIPRHDLREMRGRFAALTDRDFYENTEPDDYLHLILTDEEDVPEAFARLRNIYPNLMKLSYDNTRTRENHQIDPAENVRRKSPLELFNELYEKQNNQPMSEEQRNYAEKLMEAVREEML